MSHDKTERFELSRAKLLAAIGDTKDITFISTPGNIGDHLIHAGTRQLLSGRSYREVDILEAQNCQGDLALLGGGGYWCGPYHDHPERLAQIEERFERVIVLPCTYDTSIHRIREILCRSRAKFFAREEISFGLIRNICAADIAHDCAFYFDYRPYRRQGSGTLTAFRTDQESAFRAVPTGNQDVSNTCRDLEEWLQTIANHELIRTDRAHVTIAGAMLGKRVEYLASSYHKVPAIVDYSLSGFPVTRLPGDWLSEVESSSSELTDAEHLRRVTAGIRSLIPTGETFLFIDMDQLGSFPLDGQKRVPFLEHDGIFWGPPADDQQAISELERMREAGAAYAVFAWVAFWWLAHYAGFHEHLRAHYPCLMDTPSAVVFDLRSQHRLK